MNLGALALEPLIEDGFIKDRADSTARLHVDAVGGFRVENHLQHADIVARRYDLVWRQLQVHTLLAPDRIHQADHLHRQHILSHVIANFEDYTDGRHMWFNIFKGQK